MATSANPHNPHGNHGGGVFTPAGPTHNMPYEPDRFDLKPILAVPVAVIVTTILAYVTTQLVFDNLFSTADPANQVASENPFAAEQGKKPLNDRLRSISSTDPKAEFVQPRLEAMRTKTEAKREGTYPITSEMTTQHAEKNDPSNSPEYHPEQLRADRWHELNVYAKKDGDVVQIPISKAMELLIQISPVGKDVAPLDVLPKWDREKESNGGQLQTPRKPAPAVKKEIDAGHGKDGKDGKDGKEQDKK